LDIAPEDAEALYYWAALEGEEGNATIQESLLTRYLKLRPDQATALDQLGDVLEEEHWESEAIGAWRRAIALNPGYSGAIYSLARALRRTDPVESEQLIERVHELERDQQTDKSAGKSGEREDVRGKLQRGHRRPEECNCSVRRLQTPGRPGEEHWIGVLPCGSTGCR
jgi:tetratricopeptide (TPR) repeat protein